MNNELLKKLGLDQDRLVPLGSMTIPVPEGVALAFAPATLGDGRVSVVLAANNRWTPAYSLAPSQEQLTVEILDQAALLRVGGPAWTAAAPLITPPTDDEGRRYLSFHAAQGLAYDLNGARVALLIEERTASMVTTYPAPPTEAELLGEHTYQTWFKETGRRLDGSESLLERVAAPVFRLRYAHLAEAGPRRPLEARSRDLDASTAAMKRWATSLSEIVIGQLLSEAIREIEELHDQYEALQELAFEEPQRATAPALDLCRGRDLLESLALLFRHRGLTTYDEALATLDRHMEIHRSALDLALPPGLEADPQLDAASTAMHDAWWLPSEGLDA